MNDLTIPIAPDLESKMRARAHEAGYPSLTEYVEALIIADADPIVIDSELETKLLAALQSKAITVDQTYWESKRLQLRQTRG